MKNNAYTTDTIINNMLRSNKFFIFVASLLSIIADAFISTLLFIDGVFTFAIIMTAISLLDVILIIAIIKSNFRFAYSRVFPSIYIVLSIIVTCALIPFMASNVFTITAMILFVATHVLASIAILFSMFDASKLGAKAKFMAIITLALFIGATGYYSSFVLTNGYFGQGGIGHRSIVFELDEETDTYIASNLLEGNGSIVVIPDEYNGKKISAVNSNIFNYSSLKEVHFDCDINVELIDFEQLNFLDSSDLKVYIDKTKIDDFKQILVDKFKTAVDNSNQSNQLRAVNLMNTLVPSNLKSNERYITFEYTVDSLIDADYKLIKTWIGSEGDKFNLSNHATDIDYAENYLVNDEAFLYDRFTADEKILKTLSNGDEDINNLTITSNCSNVKVEFEDVYQITVGDDNDELYETSDAFKSFNGTGKRYVLGSDHFDLLSTIEQRQGFTLSWKYGAHKYQFTNLSDVLNGDEYKEDKQVTIYPEWELNAPTIEMLSADKDNATYIYGEDATFTVSATAPVDTISLRYSWCNNDNETVGTNSNTYSLSNVNPNSSVGYYYVNVTAFSDTETSLTSQSVQSIYLTVNKKELNVTWNLPSGLTYTDEQTKEVISGTYAGVEKQITFAHDTSDVINGDVITLAINSNGVRNAGNYVVAQSLQGECDTLYYIPTNEAQKTVIINPYEATVNWTDLPDYTYCGEFLAPMSSVTPIGDDVSIDLFVSGSRKIVGSSTARVTTENTNYKLINDTKEFEIVKRNVTLNWDSANTFVYNAENQYPHVISVDNIVLGEQDTFISGLRYAGYGKDVNGYTVEASTLNTNYNIQSGNNVSYTITKAPLALTWNTTSLVYNGANQYPASSSIAVVGKYGTDVLGLTVSGNGNDVGSGYVATATITNGNYEITENETTVYQITPKSISLSWNVGTFVYNGDYQIPEVTTVNGLVGGQDKSVLNITTDGANKNAGNGYVATATIANGNYEISSGATKSYNITAKSVTIVWENVSSYIYNKENQHPNVIDANGLVGSDTFSDLLVDITTNATPVNTGSYTATCSISNTNYNIVTSSKTKTFRINPKEITIEWSSVSEFTYNRTVQKPTATAQGVISGDTVTLSYSGDINVKNVGSYTIKAGTSNTNYAISLATASKSFTITKKAVSITWNNANTYTYNSATQHPTASTSSGVISGDTVTYSYEGNGANAKDVGSYTITAVINNSNYYIEGTNSASFTIVAKSVTLNFSSNNEFEYTGNAVTFEASSTPYSDLQITYAYYNTVGNVLLAGAPSEVGSYKVVATVVGSNYVLSGIAEATFTIVAVEALE